MTLLKGMKMSEEFLCGAVYDCALCAPLENVLVELKNATGQLLERCASDGDGKWKLCKAQEEGTVLFQAEGFHSKEYSLVSLPKTVRLLEKGIIGYLDRIFYYPGEKLNCFIHSSRPYSIQLFRHGLEKVLVVDEKEYPPHIQIAPDDFFVEKGVSWNKSTDYSIPVNADPGLYSLLLKSKNYEQFAIPFLVSTPQQGSDRNHVLVLASTNNWQTYNIWGGRSRYRNFEDGKSSDFVDRFCLKTTINRNLAKFLTYSQLEYCKNLIGRGRNVKKWKLKKLSLHRPLTNCSLEGDSPFEPFNNHLAAAEWRVLAWLEKMGINYDIVSGVELHRNPGILTGYPCLLLSSHSEYWSRRMYKAVFKAHCQNHLWVINFSGNSMYREVDFFEDGSIRCVSLSFSQSCADESQLLGVRFTGDDYGSAAPYKIISPDHWVFNDAAVNPKNPFFGGLSLNQYTLPGFSRYDPGRCGDKNGLVGMGASGWETDKLTKTAPENIKLIAKGCNKHGGADMVVREPEESRGGMFSASSILFGGALLVDGVVSKIAENVIKRALGHSPGGKPVIVE